MVSSALPAWSQLSDTVKVGGCICPGGVVSLVRGRPLDATFEINLLGLLAVWSFHALCFSSLFRLPDIGVVPFPELQGLCVPSFYLDLGNSSTMSPLLEIKGRLHFSMSGIAFSYDTRLA